MIKACFPGPACLAPSNRKCGRSISTGSHVKCEPHPLVSIKPHPFHFTQNKQQQPTTSSPGYGSSSVSVVRSCFLVCSLVRWIAERGGGGGGVGGSLTRKRLKLPFCSGKDSAERNSVPSLCHNQPRFGRRSLW